MVLRDLTQDQIDVLQRRAKREYNEFRVIEGVKQPPNITTPDPFTVWQRAFSNGLKAGLELQPKVTTIDHPEGCLCVRVPPYTGCPVHA